MRNSRFWATFVATVLVASIAGTAVAQQPPGPGVAIIDLNKVFKNHLRMKAQTENMKRMIQQAEDDLKLNKTEIENLQKDLTGFKSDSLEYKNRDADLTKRKVELTARFQQQKKDFLEQEAKIFYGVYTEVQQFVAWYAERNRISLVLRFDGEPVTGTDPQGILKQINKDVLYYNRAIDITDIVLADLNRSGTPQPTGVQSGVPLPPRNPPITGSRPTTGLRQN